VVGKKYEHVVAKRLNDAGVNAIVPDREATFDKERSHYTRFNTDIIINPDSPTGHKILEVKSRRSTCPFTCADDFPFPDVFVDTESGWRDKEEKPDYYAIVSQDTEAIVAVDGKTRDEWKTRKVFDRDLGYMTKTLCAPKALLHDFDWLAEELCNE
jgi:hypothetical protein